MKSVTGRTERVNIEIPYDELCKSLETASVSLEDVANRLRTEFKPADLNNTDTAHTLVTLKVLMDCVQFNRPQEFGVDHFSISPGMIPVLHEELDKIADGMEADDAPAVSTRDEAANAS